MKLIGNIKYLIKLSLRYGKKVLALRWVRKINPLAWIADAWNKRKSTAMQRRALAIAKMIQNDLTRQGFTYVQVRKKKRNRRQKVRFKEPLICTSEMCYLMIDIAKLPYKVTTSDITTDECLRSLSDRIQSTVRTEYVHSNLCYSVRLSGKAFPVSFSYSSYKLANTAPPLAIPLGINEKQEHSFINLVDSIHLLVVGPTGKGKSTFIHSSLVTILDRNTPDDVQLWLADLKKSEFSVYEGLRTKRGYHGIVARIAYDEEDAVSMLQDAFDEMKRRQKKFQEYDAVDITDYSRLSQNYMPRIVLVIDEILQLMTSKNKAGGVTIKQWTEQHLVNLAAQGRGAGIHVIIATQVVNSEVLTTRILANFENVICFGVKDWRQSQLAIQDSRAEGLPRGRVILKFENEYSEHQTCMLSAQNKRLAVSRVVQAGPGNGLADGREDKRFLNDAMLLVRIACEQFDGQWSNAKIWQSAREENIPRNRVDEIAMKLQKDGVLMAGNSRRHGRVVAKAFQNNPQLLVSLYSDDQKPHTSQENTVIIEGEIIEDINTRIKTEHQNGACFDVVLMDSSRESTQGNNN